MLRLLKSTVPAPEKVKEEVWSWDCVGNAKTSEHVPVYEVGMSKLKIVELDALMEAK